MEFMIQYAIGILIKDSVKQTGSSDLYNGEIFPSKRSEVLYHPPLKQFSLFSHERSDFVHGS